MFVINEYIMALVIRFIAGVQLYIQYMDWLAEEALPKAQLNFWCTSTFQENQKRMQPTNQ